MTLTADLQARLSGLGVPVLAPDEVETPARYSAATDAQGRPSADGARGLAAYLAAHPGGYVQIERLDALLVQGASQRHMVTLSAVAATEATCQALADAVTLALNYRAQRPTPYALMTPASLAHNSVSVRALLTFQHAALVPL